ncbi:MAG: formate dehydrogenase beta subunit [Alphaproteobacteria bacterium]
MSVTIYISKDAAALSVGADAVADAVAREAAARAADIRIVRTGTRGALWLEPLVEVETPAGRIGYGPVAAGDVPALFAAGLLDGGAHALRLGKVDDLDWFRRQERLIFARTGLIDPLDLDGWKALGGLAGLTRAAAMPAADVITAITDSGLRGRGGAGFPAGIKWRTTADTPGAQKYVCCNADEGDSGTFADRILMEGDPFTLLEGMAIAGLAIGATQGYVYIRSEYPHAIATMRAAIAVWERAGLLGDDVLGSGRAFRVAVRRGAGAYICGEESSMLESLEGKRGMVRAKPPIPAISGLFAKPTLINNVLTLASVPAILARGAAVYRDFGSGRSRGTQAFQLAGNIRRGGLVEKAFGVTIRELIEDFGGGTASGRPFRAAQLGGPLGAYVDDGMLDLAMYYEVLAANAAMLGHGGIVVFDDSVDMAKMARYAFEFCEIESCGKCTPCRIGATRGRETVDRIIAGRDVARNLALVEDLCEVMVDGSLCAMGGLTPMPVRSAIRLFPGDFTRGAATPREA